MVHFHHISIETFLSEYWQKKPLVIRKALPHFTPLLAPDELAGLALEEEVESRLVFETTNEEKQWHLKRGPFTESDFNELPNTHWTLLVQGVDRIISNAAELLNHFDFIPQWRLDDLMISYASLHGSVGPHYDLYDVFLYQAQGRREWSITSKKCTPENHIDGLELRIMNRFDVEERFILEEGDMLYLPPHIGHYGVSLSEECMTYSFGYRSYTGQELWDSLGDYLSEKNPFETQYNDPNWSCLNNTSEITQPAWLQAQALLQQMIQDEQLMKSWFGCFATRLDQSAEQQLPMPLEEEELLSREEFIEYLKNGAGLSRDLCCRFAYVSDSSQKTQLFINGCLWETNDASSELMHLIANHRLISHHCLIPFINQLPNQILLYDLFQLQWLQLE